MSDYLVLLPASGSLEPGLLIRLGVRERHWTRQAQRRR
jgi:hypothetical protein